MKLNRLMSVSAVALAGLFASQASAVPAAIDLVLLTDVSGSVDTTEYNLQKTGYVNAFNSAAVKTLIAATPGGVRVTYVEWSTTAATTVGWTLLQTGADSAAFATALAATSRSSTGVVGTQTGVATAITYGAGRFGLLGADLGAKQVIDVSGDGEENTGGNTAAARTAALAGVVDQINGLPIGGASLVTWYQSNVQGGTGSFTDAASTFDEFGLAIQAKLFREIGGGVPDTGSTFGLFAAILGAVGFMQRRKLLS